MGKTVKLAAKSLRDCTRENSAKVEQGDSTIRACSSLHGSVLIPTADISGINVQPHDDGVDGVKLADTIRQVIARKHGASVSDDGGRSG
ncbi:hypothetical protein O9993_02960 [Vibrio lentus]|nr:hypothetical protein [Vibrio lentus]